MDRFIQSKRFLIFLLFSTIVYGGAGDIEIPVAGGKVIWNSNSQTTTLAGSGSATESVNYILPAFDGNPSQTLITDGSGVWSFADVNAVAGVHTILSVTHQDATTSPVTAGDIIFANATPKWDDLAIGTANQILRVSGGFPDWETTTFITETGALAYVDGTLALASGSITDTGGTIDFDDENLSTTGTFAAGAITGTDITGETLTLLKDFATTDVNEEMLRITRTTSGAAGDGLGLSQVYYLENPDGDLKNAANIIVDWTDADSEQSRIRFHTRTGDNLFEIMRLRVGTSFIYTALNIADTLIVDTDTLKVDSVNDRVGINKASPAVALDVVGATAIAGATTITGTLTLPTTNEINFRDTDISMGSTLNDGYLDASADIGIRMFYDNADVADHISGQSHFVYRRAAEDDDYLAFYIRHDERAVINTIADQLRVEIDGSGKLIVTPTIIFCPVNFRFNVDDITTSWGTGNDATITYDGTNMVIDPKVVGSGYLQVDGVQLATDKLAFTQTDLNEYIDSDADGDLDLHATTDIDLHAGSQVNTDTVIRGATTLYRRYYHLPLASFDPGASGTTWTSAGASTVGGWQLNAAGEILETKVDVHSDWDAASDLHAEVRFQINAASAENDTVDIKLVLYYMGVAETVTKTQTVEVATNVGDGGAKAQFTMFQADFVIDYDAIGAVVEAGDCIAMILNLETDTSEVDDVIINAVTYYYNTTHLGIEAGDT